MKKKLTPKIIIISKSKSSRKLTRQEPLSEKLHTYLPRLQQISFEHAVKSGWKMHFSQENSVNSPSIDDEDRKFSELEDSEFLSSDKQCPTYSSDDIRDPANMQVRTLSPVHSSSSEKSKNRSSSNSLLSSRPTLSSSTVHFDDSDANLKSTNARAKSEMENVDPIAKPNEDKDLVDGQAIDTGPCRVRFSKSSSFSFSEYLQPPSRESSDFQSTCFDTSSSWDYADKEAFNSKYKMYYSSEEEEDNCDIKPPLSTSTPFKNQPAPPDVIEGSIIKCLEFTDEKMDKISNMVDSMQSEVKQLDMMTKRKELNNRILSESFDKMNDFINKAGLLNESICSKAEMSKSDLLSSWRMSDVDDDYGKESDGKFTKRLVVLF